MRKYLAGSALCRELQVRYYLLAGEVRDGRRMYGVLVESGGGRELIPSVTPSRRRAQSLLALLVQGHVTPVTARDVVEDWLLD
ncbi:MAG: DUF6514 family protein [Oscillospiraceae bacterium]|nr:DUF6514 family protein [Oscillospiraceae bacterium]